MPSCRVMDLNHFDPFSSRIPQRFGPCRNSLVLDFQIRSKSDKICKHSTVALMADENPINVHVLHTTYGMLYTAAWKRKHRVRSGYAVVIRFVGFVEIRPCSLINHSLA